MKKLLALLLSVCMLLPAAAFADAVEMSFSMQIGKEVYRSLLEEYNDQFGQEIPSDVLETLAEVVCGILEVTEVECTVQENGIEAEVLLQGNRLISAAVTVDGTELVISTSLLKDHVLVLDMAEALNTVSAVDWSSLLADMSSTVQEWYLTRDISYDEIGNFAGSAYENGSERILIRLDDMDIALLVEGLLIDIEASSLLPMLEDVFGHEAVAKALHDIRAYNYEAALDNAYDYELAVVMRTEGLFSTFAGLSLNVLHEDEQAWSLSVGADEGDAKIIAAFNADGKTNYFAFTEMVEQLSSRETKSTTAFGIYQAEEGALYADAAADPSKAVLYNEIVLTTVTSGTPTHYRREITGAERSVTNGAEALSTRTEIVEKYSETPFMYRMESKQFMGDALEAACVYSMTAETGENFAHPADAERVSIMELAVNTALQEEIASAIMDDGMTAMSVTAFKSIPVELLMQLLQLMQ